MSKIRKFNFNMVEIAVAIAIVAFGVASMMGVFPTILKQGKRASENDKVADVVSMVKAFVDVEYSAVASWNDFCGLFQENENGSPVSTETEGINIASADQFAPLIFEDADGKPWKPEDKLFQAPFRVAYYRGKYDVSNVANNGGRKLLAAYEVKVWREPISSLNINGKYYEACDDDSCKNNNTCSHGSNHRYRFEPGATIVIKVATPAGVVEEEQEISYYRFDYLSK